MDGNRLLLGNWRPFFFIAQKVIKHSNSSLGIIYNVHTAIVFDLPCWRTLLTEAGQCQWDNGCPSSTHLLSGLCFWIAFWILPRILPSQQLFLSSPTPVWKSGSWPHCTAWSYSLSFHGSQHPHLRLPRDTELFFVLLIETSFSSSLSPNLIVRPNYKGSSMRI